MSVEQQHSRIAEAPSQGWVVWLSTDAFELVKQLLESVAEDENPGFRSKENRKMAEDILEGIY